MSQAPAEHRTVHSRTIAARAETLYDLVADVTRWPVIFEPTLHVDHLERTEHSERFQLWAQVKGEVKTWISRRGLDRSGLNITFAQERSQAPFSSMSGEWSFRPLPSDRTEVMFTHCFTVDDSSSMDWVTSAVDRNSRTELDALRRVAELDHAIGDIYLSFSDSARVSGSIEAAYSFIDRADLWPGSLPHVGRVDLTEPQPGIQHMVMDTATSDGHTHTTKSVRLSFPDDGLIVYKQLLPPDLLFGHSGAWSCATDADGEAVITASHKVAIDPAAVPEVLGAESTVADARSYVRDALGANSRTTMTHAAAAVAGGEAIAAGEASPPERSR